MRIKRSKYNEWVTDADRHGKNSNLIRAISLLIFVKHDNPTSCIKDFSYYKLHQLTGLHYTTLRKRIQTLKNLGLIEFIGKGNTTLRFKRIASRNNRNNINLDHLNYDSVADVEKSLYAQFIVEILIRKEYVKQVIKSKRNPKSQKEFEWAKDEAKRCRIDKTKFEDWGLSYKTIADKLHIGVQKAMMIVKYAIRNKFIRKVRQRKQWVVEKIKGAFNLAKFEDVMNGFTFMMSNCVVKVKANKYRIGSRCPLPLITPLALLDNEK